MNKKEELKIAVLSNIKEEIIDKQSEKRHKLMTKKRAPRWVMPSSVAAVILVAIMVPILILLFAKQVPVYEGMTVSNYKPSSSAENVVAENVVPEMETHRFSYLSSTNGNNSNGNGNNGNHYGQNKKPVDEIIEEDTSIGIEIPEQPMYYAKAGQEIYITVHISNPDSFEILSFTLNGKKYSSYMFEEGSDMENLILKVNIGDVSGVVEYTIDAIKYVDGTEIKDVDMRGERTVKVGVYSDNQPTVSVTQTEAGFDAFSAKISITDELELIKQSGGIAYAIICDDEKLINAQKIEQYSGYDYNYTGLNLDKEYRFFVIAFYDSFDGTGISTHTLHESSFKTQALIEITAFDSDVHEISGEYKINTRNGVTASNVKVELYLGEDLVQSIPDSIFEFSNLEEYTDYTVKFSLDYDLGDGKGKQNLTATRQIKTKPYISASSCKVLNTSAIYEGDTIYLKVALDNPNGVEITSVTVNGIDCPIVGESTGSYLNIEVINNGQFGAGHAKLRLESINLDQYRVTVKNDMSDDLFIYGEFAIEDIYFVNNKFEKVEWAFPSEEVFVMVSLKNPTGYDVISIDGQTDIRKYDDEHYYYPRQHQNYIRIDKVEYRDPLNKNGAPISFELEYGIETYLMIVDSDETKYISSASELMNISGGYYYELTNDIDLDGVNWKPIEYFAGVLNGKGHSIKNLSIVGAGPSDYVGLFGTMNGGVENLTFTEATIIINRAKIKFGLVCGMLGGLHDRRGAFVKNCTVDDTCSVIVNTDYETFDSLEYYVGGLVGHAKGKIIGCKNSGSVSGNAEHVGGIVGGADWGSLIKDCINYGEVRGFRGVGGIAGTVYGNTVSKCENSGTVSGGDNVGGIAGFTAESVVDCKNSGTIQGINISFGPDNRYGSSVGGIAGMLDNITIGQTKEISGCENSGDVKGSNQVGGIVGYTSGKTVECVNNGNISSEYGDSVGGIAGGSYLGITDCKDNGTVNGETQ